MDSKRNLERCYNKGCGKFFDPLDNEEGSCIYHSGKPYFHDAYKEWTCCHKKSIDFTDFLNIKGCTQNKHNSTKPVEEGTTSISIKEKNEDIRKAEHSVIHTRNIVQDRPSNLPLVSLAVTISPRLREEIQKLTTKFKTSLDTINSNVIQDGTHCQNNGCKQVFKKDADLGPCTFHAGVAVFHEGLKYWSCCKKRSTDFEKFLEQVGCTFGNHVWIKQKNVTNSCRYDWHQTASDVVLTVYAKKYNPEKCSILASPVQLEIKICFFEDEENFEKSMELFEVIDVENSSVNMLPTRIEINLKKTTSVPWPTLDLNKS